MGIIGFFIFLILLSLLIFAIYLTKFDNFSEVIKYIKSQIFKKSRSINHDIQIGDLFVNNDILIQPDNPFTDNDIKDHCDEIFIVKDLKTNHRGELWVQYISVKNITRGFDWTREMSADDFLYLNQKRNDLKELFNL
jgi:hypothetical protein